MKNLTTLGGLAGIFLGVSYGLFVRPEQAVLIFPALGLLFLWADFRRETAAQTVFYLLAAGLAAAAAWRARADLPLILIEFASMVALGLALSKRRVELDTLRLGLAHEVEKIQKHNHDLERNLAYYRQHQQAREAQARLRRDFAEAAQHIASALNYDDIKGRLMAALRRYFPHAKVSLVSGAARDAIEQFASGKHVPVLVSDTARETRFKVEGAFRSAIVVPLYLTGKVAGFIRLEAPEPNSLAADGLRTVDLFSTLATLAMENTRLYEQVQRLAVHDGLTQLFTHRAFEGRLKEEVLRAARSQTPLSLIMCDIDHFKKYNDTFGHQAGDQLLKTVSGILSSFARDVDFVARYGGEEFAVILPSTVRNRAGEIAEAIRQRVASEPFLFHGQKTQVTMSFGVATFPQDATSENQLVRSADERLYRAKKGGRNQVVV